MCVYPHNFTVSMDWESSDVTGEPVTTDDFFVESISGDESEESNYSSFSDTDEDSDEETDEGPNLIEDCYDNIITDQPLEDLESQNFLDVQVEETIDRLDSELQDLDSQNLLDVEIQDLESQNILDAEFRNLHDSLDAEIQELHVLRDSLNVICDAVDKKIQETHAMVLGDDIEEEPDSEFLALFLADYTKEELEDSEESEIDTEEEPDSELLALFLADYTKEELENSEESVSGYGIYQAADIVECIPMEINGLGPQQSSLQKIVDWLVNME